MVNQNEVEMKVLTRFNSFFDRAIDVMFYVATGMTLVIFFSVCIELFMRNFFNRPQIWSVEVTEYTMLYITLFFFFHHRMGDASTRQQGNKAKNT